MTKGNVFLHAAIAAMAPAMVAACCTRLPGQEGTRSPDRAGGPVAAKSSPATILMSEDELQDFINKRTALDTKIWGAKRGGVDEPIHRR